MTGNCDWNMGVGVNGGGNSTNGDNSLANYSIPNSGDPFELPLGNYTMEGLQEAYEEFCLDSPPRPPQPQLQLPPQFSAGPVLAPPPVAQCYEPYRGYEQMMNMLHFQDNMQFRNYHNDRNNVGAIPGAAAAQNFRAGNGQQGRRLRKKKSNYKTYREMTYQELTADAWAWRKYGQKPIKGSPFPRNYYRCSTSKGCAARRQVEKCPNSDKYMVWYTGVHTHPRPAHRSSLAGTVRNRNGAARAVARPRPGHINVAGRSKVNAANNADVDNVVDFSRPADMEIAGGSGEGSSGSGGEDNNNNNNNEMLNADEVMMNNEEEFEMFPDNAFMVPPWTPTAYGGDN